MGIFQLVKYFLNLLGLDSQSIESNPEFTEFPIGSTYRYIGTKHCFVVNGYYEKGVVTITNKQIRAAKLRYWLSNGYVVRIR